MRESGCWNALQLRLSAIPLPEEIIIQMYYGNSRQGIGASGPQTICAQTLN